MRVFPNGLGQVFLLGIFVLFAFLRPALAGDLSEMGNGVLAKGAIWVIFFVQGWKLRTQKIAEALRDPMDLLRGQAAIFLLPLLVLTFGLGLGCVRNPWTTPLFLLAVLPTTISSCVVYSRAAGGDADYALVQSTLSNLLAPLVLAIACYWLDGGGWGLGIDRLGALTVAVGPKIFLLILGPCLLGWMVRAKASSCLPPGKWSRIGKNAPLLGIAFLAYLAFGKVLVSHGTDLFFGFIVELLGLLVCGWVLLALLSWFWSRLTQRQGDRRVASFFCCSQKSLAMGLPVIYLLGASDEDFLVRCIIPLLLFHLIQLLMAAPLIPWLRKFASARRF